MEPIISSTSTFPTIIPKCLVANLRSSAALSKSSWEFFSSKCFKFSTQASKLCLCLSLVIKVSFELTNLFFSLSLILVINSSKFVSFLIDKNNVVRHQVVNDLPLGRNVDEMLRMVDALAFHEEHGEVCPAGWQDGQKGMKESPEGVAEYLSSEADNL